MHHRVIVLTFLLLAWPVPVVHSGEPARPLRNIGFGSCMHQDKPQPIWKAIVASRPELFIFGGDNIYGDTSDMTVLRKKYEQLAAQPGYQELLRTCPLLATWDDHDLGKNDAGTEYAKKEESQQIFLDFFKVPASSPRRKQEGVYHAQVFGPPEKSVQVILLDTRYFRSALKKRTVPRGIGPYIPDPTPGKTVLGEAQWKWLAEQLQVPAKVRLLVSSIQVVPEDHGWEKWMNLPLERERLYKLLRETKAAGVIILSGDRHLAELSMMDAGLGYPLYDLTSSGLNQAATQWRPQEENRHRVGTMNFGHNFGVIRIDWDRQDPLLALQIRDEEGDLILQQKIPLSLLQPGSLKAQASAVRLASGEPLTAAAVKENLNRKVTVELTVLATGASKTMVFLNSAVDRLAAENFTVVLDQAAQGKLRSAGIADPRKHFQGKRLAVTGTLSLFQERPQIRVTEPDQIRVLASED